MLERVGFITAREWRILPTAVALNPLAIADRMLPDMVCAGAFMTCKCRVLKPVLMYVLQWTKYQLLSHLVMQMVMLHEQHTPDVSAASFVHVMVANIIEAITVNSAPQGTGQHLLLAAQVRCNAGLHMRWKMSMLWIIHKKPPA